MVSTARLTGASLRADLENSRAHNHRLTIQLRALEKRLSQAEGTRLIADNALPGDIAAELADSHLAGRCADLEQQLFEAKDQLCLAIEELEAARTINRELMQRANRPTASITSDSSAPTPPTPKQKQGSPRNDHHPTR